MIVVINQMKMELKKDLTPTEALFVKNMASKGFLFTYYPKDDTHNEQGGSVKSISVALKEGKTIKI